MAACPAAAAAGAPATFSGGRAARRASAPVFFVRLAEEEGRFAEDRLGEDFRLAAVLPFDEAVAFLRLGVAAFEPFDAVEVFLRLVVEALLPFEAVEVFLRLVVEALLPFDEVVAFLRLVVEALPPFEAVELFFLAPDPLFLPLVEAEVFFVAVWAIPALPSTSCRRGLPLPQKG
jgi:hypothetical protein